jgi:hypothetical protein
MKLERMACQEIKKDTGAIILIQLLCLKQATLETATTLPSRNVSFKFCSVLEK